MIINPTIYSGSSLPELDNPGTAADLLAGKQLVDQYGNPLTGTMPQKSAGDLTASGAVVTVPAGYYPEQVSKSVAGATQAAPAITVSSAGLITAKHTQTAGYVAAGTKSATKQLTAQAGTTITPGTAQKTAVAKGRYTTGAVYVAGDANLKAENIKSGVSIFGVAGSYEGDIKLCKVTIVNNSSEGINYSDFIDKDGVWYNQIASKKQVSIYLQAHSLIVIYVPNSYTISGDAMFASKLSAGDTNIFGIFGDCTITIR